MARVCPWWLGFFLANPIRRIKQDPEKILGPYVSEGMVLADVGPGMGYLQPAHGPHDRGRWQSHLH